MIAMQIPRSSRTSRTVFIFFMRVLYQRLEGLSRGNLRKLENGTLFDQNLSVRPFCQKLLPAIKRGLLSAVEAVQNLLRGAKGDEDDEHGERGVFHVCIIPRIGKNARRKKRKLTGKFDVDGSIQGQPQSHRSRDSYYF
jgi:hypothetical protein